MAEAQSPAELEGGHPGSVDLSAHDAGAPSATLNRKNVAKVRDVIAELDPARFDMSGYVFGAQNSDDAGALIHNCKTAGCIAGWTAAVLGKPMHHDTDEFATDALGLEYDERSTLFCMHDTSRLMEDAEPKHAVAVLDILLETGRVDWDAAFERVAAAEAVAK